MSTQDQIKCVVWDLDETLWSGVLAEAGTVALKAEIPRILETLDQRGILLSIASRNEHDDARAKLEALGLWHYFLYPQIHWGAKSTSLARIREELNIGMDAILFIDDSAFERDEVVGVHPEIATMAAEDYLGLIDDPRLMPRFITTDSAKRRQMYLDDSTRKQAEDDFVGPREDFLAGLNMRFTIAEAGTDDLPRAVELTVRTNQLNASGRTYDYDQLDDFRRRDDHALLMCELSDRYGSYGKIGLALVERGEGVWHLRLLLMSCRVMSRGVGTVLLAHIMQRAKAAGVRLLADFVPTGRNRAMMVTLRFNGFSLLESVALEDGRELQILEADLQRTQPHPNYLEVVAEAAP